MTAVYQGVAKIITGMKRPERNKLLGLLLEDSALLEDLEDALLIARRRHEKSAPLEAFADRMRRKGRLTALF